MLQARTIHAMLASAALALAIDTLDPTSAHADSPLPATIPTSGYSILRVPQAQAANPPAGGTTNVTPAASGDKSTTAPSAVRVPFPLTPKTSSTGGASTGAAGASSQASQTNAGQYVPASKRQKTRRQPLGW